MKQLFALLLGSAVLTSLHAQDIGGCTSYFADNYDPIATYNDSTCVYDLQQLLVEGTSIGDLLFSGVLESELIGLFAAGGVIVHVDSPKGQALIGCAHNSDLYYRYYNESQYDECLTGNLLAEELTAFQFGSEIFSGRQNWKILRESYASQYGWQAGTSGAPYGDGMAMASGIFWDRMTFMGYNDWFVPNVAELSAYLELAYNLETYSFAPTVTLDWPLDPFGNGFETLRFPIYDFGGSHYYATSQVTNAGAQSDFVNDQLVYIASKSMSYNGNIYDITGRYETSNYNPSSVSLLPMRIEEFGPVNTSINCKDWDYAGTVNQAIDAGVTCSYPLFQCDSVTSDVWDELVIGIYPANTSVVEYGRSDTRDILLNIPSTHEIDGNIYDVIGFEVNSVANVPTGLTINIAESDVVNGSDVHCIEFTEYALEEGVFDLDIAGTLYMDILGSTLTTDITLEHRIAVTANVNGVEGCIYPTADNYNALATNDDGTCLFGGICPGDFNNDGIIGIMDILHLLGIYDTTCE
jgi:hypothetical protein